MYKILRVIWDNSSRYPNISEELKQTMLTATKISVIQFCESWEVDDVKVTAPDSHFFITNDLNDILKKSEGMKYTHVIVFSIGLVLEDIRDLIEGLGNQLKTNPKIVGHILHHGINDNSNFFTLHDQTLMLSKEAVDSLRRDDFVFNNSQNYKTDKWIKVARTDENFHDNYTPLKIWKDQSNDVISMEKTYDDGFGEDLIQYAMSKDWQIDNFNDMCRISKKYSYYYEQPEKFQHYIEQPLEVIHSDKQEMTETQYDFLSSMKEFAKIGNHTKWYGYNNEDLEKGMPDSNYDLFVGVASGFLPWLYLSHYNFTDNAKVLLVDINDLALDFQRWFLETYNPEKNLSWQDWIKLYSKYNKNVQGVWSPRFIEQSNEVWKQHKPLIDSKWEKIKNYDYTFECNSMITKEKNLVYEFLKQANQPMVWMSNIFTYDGTVFSNAELFEDFLSKIFCSNQKVSWTSKSPYGVAKFSYGPNSLPGAYDDYFEEISVPKFDTTQFLKEIENLEKHNLFVKHRGDVHPGWSSFVLHGIDWNKTNDYGDYGYASNEETPYKFVDYAKQHIPSIVEYFQNNQIHNIKNYHRIRIMKLAPGGYISLHNDTPDGQYDTNGWNLNMAINNPDNCEMHFWNDRYLYLGQVPWKPGKAFEIRTNYNHLVRNLSNEIRYHIIVHGE